MGGATVHRCDLDANKFPGFSRRGAAEMEEPVMNQQLGGYRFWVAQRFTAAIQALIKLPRL